MIFQSKKTPLQALKTRCRKKLIIDMFSKGLLHGFGPKLAIFPSSFFQAIYDILERKNAFFGYKNKVFKRSKNKSCSKGVNAWFWSKYGHFSNLFFSALQVRKMTFSIFKIENTSLQAIKTRSSKSRKIDIYPRWLTHGFGPNIIIF